MKKLFISSFIFFILIIISGVTTVIVILNINQNKTSNMVVYNEIIDDKIFEMRLKENKEISAYLYEENLNNKNEIIKGIDFLGSDENEIINLGIDIFYVYNTPTELIVETTLNYHFVKINNIEKIVYFCLNK